VAPITAIQEGDSDGNPQTIGDPTWQPLINTPNYPDYTSGANNGTGAVTGAFECLALAPEAATGPTSAQFTVNAMYVTGQITGAVVDGGAATLTGTANIAGLGAGTNVSFTFEVRKGGPGATSVLRVASLPNPFNEILIEGSFELPSGGS